MFLIFELKKSFTVEISLYINKYNVYASFFLKKKQKPVTYNLEYYWILKKRWILKILIITWEWIKRNMNKN